MTRKEELQPDEEPDLTPSEERMLRDVGDEAECSWQEESMNPSTPPQPSKEGWEEGFDEKFDGMIIAPETPEPYIALIGKDEMYSVDGLMEEVKAFIQPLLKEERSKAEKYGAVKALESIIFMYSDDARREDLANLLDDIQEDIAFKIQHPEVVLTHDTTQE